MNGGNLSGWWAIAGSNCGLLPCEGDSNSDVKTRSSAAFQEAGCIARIRRGLKISAVAVLLGLLAAPASAQAPQLSQEQQHLCYSWLSLPHREIAKRIHADVKAAVGENPTFRKASARVLKCLRGAVESAQPDVRDICLAGGVAPDALISHEIGNAIEICLTQAVQGPPVDVIPLGSTAVLAIGSILQSLLEQTQPR